jgi:AcrR family transcriptional regulator
MSSVESPLRAPGRGQYDRQEPRARRQAAQRVRLLSATALVLARERTPNVAAVVRAAGVGRNSFYEYFDDFEHARDALLAELERSVADALRAAERSVRTPVECFRSLAATWFEFATLRAEEWLSLSALAPTDGAPLSRAGKALADALQRSVASFARRGVIARAPDRERSVLVAAAGEALARPFAHTALSIPSEQRSRHSAQLERVRGLLVDTAVRLLH